MIIERGARQGVVPGFFWGAIQRDTLRPGES